MANLNPNPDTTRQQDFSAFLHYGNVRMVFLGGLQGSDAPCGLAGKVKRLEHRDEMQHAIDRNTAQRLLWLA